MEAKRLSKTSEVMPKVGFFKMSVAFGIANISIKQAKYFYAVKCFCKTSKNL